MFVVGTAGHVDHGKSTLIQALTGRHPDRLAEERDREMSIVLGFDTLRLPSGKELGIVDVPGHRDFIENMLSGIGGIDAAIFVIAADEGVMPQTREHLAILDLLEIENGVIALTKIDVVEDHEWLDLVELDIRETCAGTVLADAPLIRVSGKNKTGLEELLAALDDVLADRLPRPDLERPRLSVDRSFTVSGFGTVVTGTLLDGSLQLGQEIILLPRGMPGRVRGLQTHNQDVDSVNPGRRTAVNISGVDVQKINRGDVLTVPDKYSTSRRLDVHFRLLPNVIKPLEHNVNAKLFLGADEVLSRVRLLGLEVLSPGSSGFLQLETEEPVVAARGDHYILRRPSPSETIGGGIVLDPQPEFRYKRFDHQVITRLSALTSGDPVDILREVIQQEGAIFWKSLMKRSNLKPGTAQEGLEELIESGFALQIEPPGNSDPLISQKEFWENLRTKMMTMIKDYQQKHPLRMGMPRAQLKSQYEIPLEVFETVLHTLLLDQELEQQGPLIKTPDHQILFSKEQERYKERLLAAFNEQPYSPPNREECIELVGEELLEALVTLGDLIPVSEDVLFTRDIYEDMIQQVKQLLQTRETITVAEIRDHFESSRRYILAFLEHLDARGLTIREGDSRRLR